jgi:hypothetical protein
MKPVHIIFRAAIGLGLLDNAVHAFTGAMTLIRVVDATTPWPLWGLTAFYVAYALGYGWLLLSHRPT